MSTQQAKTQVQSNEDVAALSSAGIEIYAKYTFADPFSINGPSGIMEVTITHGFTGQEMAFGEITIHTLWGLGTFTKLTYTGMASFNGSTGYTTIEAEGHGTMQARPHAPKHINAKINASLAPGFESGSLSVEGFFINYELKAVEVRRSNA